MLRWTRPALLTLATLAGVLLLAGPAAAHAGLSGSAPADGAVLAEAPAAVTLTFSAAVRGPEVTVTGPDGATVGGEATADGSLVTVPVALAAAGRQTVDWAVTSADGHRLAGTLTFDWTPPVAAAPTTDAPSGAEVTAGSTTPAPAAAEPSEAASAGPVDGPGSGGALVTGTVALLVLAVLGAVVVLVRRRRG